MGLIGQLKEEHVQLVHLFEEIKEGINVPSVNEEVLLETISELKEILSAHLDLENKLLYPKLAESDNAQAKELGKKYSGEMVGILNTALAFFGKYVTVSGSELKNNKTFETELVAIIGVVAKRINVEENILFPAFEKYCA